MGEEKQKRVVPVLTKRKRKPLDNKYNPNLDTMEKRLLAQYEFKKRVAQGGGCRYGRQ